MPIKLKCACGKSLKVPDSAAGRMAKCPGCGNQIDVPLAAEVLDDDPPARQASPSDGNVSLNCVLIIDDDPDLVATTSVLLKQRGFRVISAANREDGLVLARERGPDLIVLDVSLPQASGFDTYQELKDPSNPNNSRCQHAAVIILTPRTKDEDVERARAIGADGCVRKPFQPKDLCQKIAQMLEKRRKEGVKKDG